MTTPLKTPLKTLLKTLSLYEVRYPNEVSVINKVRELIRHNEDCLLRTCAPGHITASAWILSPERTHFLLTHHRKLDRWLQLGGHVDGEAEVHRAALREAQEESGMDRFSFLPLGAPIPIDIDVHTIPARKSEPEHEHHDIRFLLIAEAGQSLVISDESNDLQWFALDQLETIAGDDSVARLGRKAHALVG